VHSGRHLPGKGEDDTIYIDNDDEETVVVAGRLDTKIPLMSVSWRIGLSRAMAGQWQWRRRMILCNLSRSIRGGPDPSSGDILVADARKALAVGWERRAKGKIYIECLSPAAMCFKCFVWLFSLLYFWLAVMPCLLFRLYQTSMEKHPWG